MYFKRLEMHGFKSFAEPVVIEFHEGVTCVVGPNGSGKSNISDAIRWVLGEQSPKTLRGGKMEEVIFAGTANRKMRGMAEVNLVIDNSSGILDIDYNEVAITRRMFRSGDSEYLINNVPCRLKDIRKLIMDTGIGVDGYSIIGQGKIADIVSNKPESRREIFEEAAGVVAYKTRKGEAERKLEITKANLERANDIIGELESRIPGLKEEAAKAEEFLRLRKEYEELEVNIILNNLESIKKKQDIFAADIEDLTHKISVGEEEAYEANRILSNAQKDNEELEERGNEAQNRLLSVIDKYNHISNRDKVKEEKLAALERDEQRLRAEAESLKVRLTEEMYSANKADSMEAQFAEEISKVSEKLNLKLEEYSAVLEQKNQADEALNSDREQVFNLHKTVSEKVSELKSLETLRETLINRNKELIAEWDKEKDDNLSSRNNLADAEAKHDEWSRKIDYLKDSYNRAVDALDKLGKDKQAASEALRQLTVKEGQISSRKKTIEEMEANYEGYNYGVRFIMKSQAKGIDGVVAELIKVPEGYGTAIETALGGSLQNIVCQKEDDAKAAIEILKANNAGRLTFLPINRISGQVAAVEAAISEDKDFIGIGSELCNYHKEYKGIFDFLLGKTVVVKTIDSAIRLSKKSKGLRFVTLSGEIINPTGSISGGRYKNKTASLIERRAEIAKLENELSYISNEIAINEEALLKIEEDIIHNKETEKEDGKLIKEAEAAVISLEERLSYLRSHLNQSDESNLKYESQISSIKDDLKGSEEITERLRREISDGKNLIESISRNNSSKTADGEQLNARLKELSAIVTELKVEKSQKDAQLENAVMNKARITKAIDALREAKDDNEKNLSDIEAARAELLNDSGEDASNLGLLKTEREALEESIRNIKNEKSILAENLGKATKKLSDINHRNSGLKEQKYQLEIKSAKNDTQEEVLNARLWDEFEMSYAQALDKKNPNFVMSSSVKLNREIKNRMREIGDVNVGSIKEYEELGKRYDFLVEQRKDIIFASDELNRIIKEMSDTIKEKFKENFDKVVTNFEEIFTELFGGGSAQLTMEDESNPLESGIDIVAQPPGKKLQNINLMSGGEKTMTAIALMFAVLKAKPTPFCILDEVEAALDDANIDRFSNYLRNFEDVQFVLVTHQKATMEHADVLYGVTMAEQGVSKLLSLKLGDDIRL